jgi:hypothetical protein
VTTEDQRAALDAEGSDAMAAAGIPRASIAAAPHALAVSSALIANVRGYVVRLRAAGRGGGALWFADATHDDPDLYYSHRDYTAAAALKPVLRRIPKEAK